jgi:predicted phosphodiesterase
MTLKLSILSDLHLEFLDADKITKLVKCLPADVLVLAGDICAIGSPEDYNKLIVFLKYMAPKFKHILHVAGNHEYYYTRSPPTKEHTIPGVNRKLKAIEKEIPNYKYLNCNMITLDINNKKYDFIGATTWTRVERSDRIAVENMMNDYNYIFCFKDGSAVKFTVDDMQKLHSKHTSFIKKSIEELKNSKTPLILITHHKPISNYEKGERSVSKQAYETDLLNIIKLPVKVSIYGHTHEYKDEVISGIRFISNPKGYKHERTGFTDSKIFEI